MCFQDEDKGLRVRAENDWLLINGSQAGLRFPIALFCCQLAPLHSFSFILIHTEALRIYGYQDAYAPFHSPVLLPACTTSPLQLYPHPYHGLAHMKIPKCIAFLHSPVLLPACTTSQLQLQLHPRSHRGFAHTIIPSYIALFHSPVLLPACTTSQLQLYQFILIHTAAFLMPLR